MLEVSNKCCGQCLFSKNKIVSDERKKEVLDGCESRDTHFICHKADDVVCRGFFEKKTSQGIRWAKRLDFINFVEVE